MIALCTAATALVAPAVPSLRYLASAACVGVQCVEMAPPPGFVWANFDQPVVVEAAPEEGLLSVEQACQFMYANPNVGVIEKKAFLEEKGVSAFVIAEAECCAAEDNVQGHPELPAPAAPTVASWYDSGARL